MTEAFEIRFYRAADEPYGAFSNFAAFPIAVRGMSWPSSEHYFQAQKFVGTPHEAAIRLAPSPMAAARMGRSHHHTLRPDWEAVKEHVMLEALRAKFTQHGRLSRLLLSTGDAVIIEHTRKDLYWADGGDGSGLNRLGHLLMQVRSELRAGTHIASSILLIKEPGAA